MSDPSASWHYFQHGSLKRTGVRKSRSELENVDSVSASGCNEVEAGDFEDGKKLFTGLSPVDSSSSTHRQKRQIKSANKNLLCVVQKLDWLLKSSDFNHPT